jgi:hypothetical protein
VHFTVEVFTLLLRCALYCRVMHFTTCVVHFIVEMFTLLLSGALYCRYSAFALMVHFIARNCFWEVHQIAKMVHYFTESVHFTAGTVPLLRWYTLQLEIVFGKCP